MYVCVLQLASLFLMHNKPCHHSPMVLAAGAFAESPKARQKGS